MRKLFFSFICFLAVFFLSSCDKADELGKNSVVSVIYADFKNNSYVFTAETSDFSTLNESGDSAEVKFFSGVGNTPATAWEDLKSTFSYSPYFGHVNAIVLLEGFYKKNIKEVMEFLISENSISPNAAVYITKCNPYDFENLLISRMAVKKTLPSNEMYEFFSPANYNSDIPILKCKNDFPYCDTTALFKGLSYQNELPENYFLIYSLIKNRDYEKNFKTFEISSSKAKVSNKNKHLKIDLEIFLKSITPISHKEAEKIFTNELEAFLKYLIKENKTYILSNEEFRTYEYNIRLSLKENSKLKGREQ